MYTKDHAASFFKAIEDGILSILESVEYPGEELVVPIYSDVFLALKQHGYPINFKIGVVNVVLTQDMSEQPTNEVLQ